jgi:diguanylate cyclase (GGDEF)-like protein
MAIELKKIERKFRLLRYFGITSLLGVLVVLAPLVYFYRAASIETLERHVTDNNVNITKILTNTVWINYVEYFEEVAKTRNTGHLDDEKFREIRDELIRQTQGLPVVKVKIYDKTGIVVFSMDPAEVGEDKSNDDGFIQALRGDKAVSEIVLENQFDEFENKLMDRNLISSYVPMHVRGSVEVSGAFEVYSDVTDYVNELKSTTWKIVAVVAGSMSFLYLFMFGVVRKADRALKLQESEIEQAHEAVITHQALHDHLTGLANRLNLLKTLDALLYSTGMESEKCAVLCLGIDGLKSINDSFGHQSGDASIIEVSRRLEAVFGEESIIARLGGDEFAVVISDLKSDVEFEQIVEKIDRMQKAISSEPFHFNGHEISLSTSVGVSIFPDDGKTVEDVLQAAERAQAHTKKEGRGGYQFHAQGMNARAMDMLLMERELRKALVDDQFALFYQPKVDIHSGKIVGAEALIRWNHPTRGLIGPGAFIEVVEERGLVIPLGEWVLREACRQNAAWQKAGMAHMPIAINLSAAHFNKASLISDVKNALREHSLDPECLELELTESSFMKDTKSSVSVMNDIRALGVFLALDDFGTGYSSLSQLKGLPLHNLKLDQSFVRGLPEDRDDLAICTAVIAMGNALEMKVIAEGVETLDQLVLLRSLGADVAQGYHIAKPLPADKFLEFAIQNVKDHPSVEPTAESA